jgi:DNA-binding transcriptional MocR family regulator
MEAISDLPMLNDIDADYSPQYVKLARILRGKIESGQYQPGDTLPASVLAQEHGVSVRVACHALAMLAANRYVRQQGRFAAYAVTWQGTGGDNAEQSRAFAATLAIDSNGLAEIQ